MSEPTTLRTALTAALWGHRLDGDVAALVEYILATPAMQEVEQSLRVASLRKHYRETMADADALAACLVVAHRVEVSEFSDNMGGHVAIREGWVPYDADTPVYECETCDALRKHQATRGSGSPHPSREGGRA